MKTKVKLRYSDSEIVFKQGSFDNYCVYISKKEKPPYPPKDTEYFNFFKELQTLNNNLDVYQNFVEIYNNTNKNIEQKTLDIIDNIILESNLNGKDKKVYEGYLVVIYMAMIAEENKKNTKLGKRIKRLGMYNLLRENMTSDAAANNSRGKKWEVLDKEMQEKGF